jgi:MEMO1 family protein
MLTSGRMWSQPIRAAAVAGSWYPGTADRLGRTVDGMLAAVTSHPAGVITALVVPHAGIDYSGQVAAHAYRAIAGSAYDVAVLIGPSHYVSFEGVSVFPRGCFATPLGPAVVAEKEADAIMRATAVVHAYAAAHQREHSLEMQLPFLRRVLPDTPIVPLVMGHQVPATAAELADALAEVLRGRRSLLVASSDLSHFNDAEIARRLDGRILRLIERLDAGGLQEAIEEFPNHACGGGAIVAVVRAAVALGARQARILCYGDSGDVSGDKKSVVGYVAAALGSFGEDSTGSAA